VRLGIAEVDQEPIPEILSDMPVEALDDLGALRLVDANDLAQVFRVEPTGEGGGVDQIAEQDGQLPPFGVETLALGGSGLARRQGRGVATPDEDPTVLVPGNALSVEEFLLEGLERGVIQIQLHLERPIGHASAPPQHRGRMIEDVLKSHDSRARLRTCGVRLRRCIDMRESHRSRPSRSSVNHTKCGRLPSGAAYFEQICDLRDFAAWHRDTACQGPPSRAQEVVQVVRA
jgi:hypothetical protein